MGVTVYQGGKQGSLIMVPGRSLRPLAAKEGKGSHVQNRTFGHYHCSIFDGRLGYGNDQAGPVEKRTGITPTGRHGATGTGIIEVYVFSGHTSLSFLSISAARLLLFSSSQLSASNRQPFQLDKRDQALGTAGRDGDAAKNPEVAENSILIAFLLNSGF